MTDMLKDAGLWEAVNGDESDKKKVVKAMNAITKNVLEDQLELILDTDTANAAWTLLKEEYDGSSSQDVATLTMQLNGVRLNTGANERTPRRIWRRWRDWRSS